MSSDPPFLRTIILRIALLIGAMTILVGTAAVVAGRAAPAAAQMIFLERAGYDARIYVIDLTHMTRADIFSVPAAPPADLPKLSMNGQRIVFTFWNESGLAIRAFNAARQPLYTTENELEDRLANWSPDGSQIAFWSNRMTPNLRSRRWQNWNFYIVNLETGDVRQITNEFGILPYWLPLWSPDGQRILLNYWRPVIGAGMYVVDLRTGDLQPIRGAIESGSDISWSPDSRHLAFRSNPNGNSEVFVLDTLTAETVNLTQHPASEFEPDWSPDGQHIAFTSNRGGKGDIYVMNHDGSNVRRVTDGGGWHPMWSPDAQQIAFLSNRSGSTAYYVVNADGTNVRLIAPSAQQTFLGWYTSRRNE